MLSLKVGTPADWPKIKAFLDNTGYFDPVYPDAVGGYWILAVEDDEIRGTIWWFEGQGNAFVSYWVGQGVYSGSMLGVKLDQLLRTRGIKTVHGMISAERERALRTALRLGMATIDIPFFYVTKELSNGRQ